jgi:hypothetical protein
MQRHIKINQSDSELASSSENPSQWVKGRNCVYVNTQGFYNYRVAIKTQTGWKNFGEFNDLETAAYVANVAILTESSVTNYQLNSVGVKDKEELSSWKNLGSNTTIEKRAKDKFIELQIIKKQEIEKEIERKLQQENELASKKAKMLKKKEENQKEAKKILSQLSKKQILALLEQPNVSREVHQILRSELGM